MFAAHVTALTFKLTPCWKVLLEKLIVTQEINKFLFFYRTKLYDELTTAC
jgi:hypothetical protein